MSNLWIQVICRFRRVLHDKDFNDGLCMHTFQPIFVKPSVFIGTNAEGWNHRLTNRLTL